MGIGYADSDKDSFWDLDLLLPAKKQSSKMKPFSSGIRTAEVVAGGDDAAKGEREEQRLTMPPADPATEVCEYTPSFNRLLCRVRITRRRCEYNFYSHFRRDAERYLTVEGEECPFAPFFSYIPQYAQLTEAQLAYYFYWRSALRRGEYLQTEESYFYLYVYEIINLPEIIHPKDGVTLLCNAWAAYRSRFPRIDKFMAEWVCDYCLIHGLPCPEEAVRPFLKKLLPLVSLREFYLGGMGDFSPHGVEMALAFYSDYRWQDSHYAAQHHDLFEKHLVAAVTPAVERLLSDSSLFAETARSYQKHDAFCGSLCAHNIKSRIEVEYYAVRDVSAVRTAITAAVKYAENKLRSLLVVKSRLTVPPFDEELRLLIDRYFAQQGESILPPTRVKEKPAYEHLYEAKTSGVNFENAAQIERLSWENTRILVPEEDAQIFEEIKNEQKYKADAIFAASAVEQPPKAEPPAEEGGSPFSQEEKTYLAMLLDGDPAGVRAVLLAASVMEAQLAEGINEKALDMLGDIVLDGTADGYRVIEEYREEVSQWIR